MQLYKKKIKQLNCKLFSYSYNFLMIFLWNYLYNFFVAGPDYYNYHNLGKKLENYYEAMVFINISGIENIFWYMRTSKTRL